MNKKSNKNTHTKHYFYICMRVYIEQTETGWGSIIYIVYNTNIWGGIFIFLGKNANLPAPLWSKDRVHRFCKAVPEFAIIFY